MISDDRLFLPLAACEYAEVSGDAAIFDEQIPYLADMKIPYGQQNIYCEMEMSDDKETLYEHCCRAVELSFELRGAHGLPFMGTGDWNDGMDAVGSDGGESVVVGWLLLLAARALLPVCKKRGDTARAMLFERESAALRAAIESNAWDKNRYIRAFFGDGTSLGSADCSECAVDCVSECFAVFANAVHAREAFETVLAALTDPVNGLIRLLTPPFDGKTRNAVGYIEGYLPGVRENGGQYTHAAAWCIIAACRLGMADTADSLFKMINPIEHGSANSIERYKGEPYAVAGDVYRCGRLAGRAAGRFTRDRQHGCIAPPLKTFSESARGEQNFLLNPAPCLMHFRLNTVSETPFTGSICTAALRMQKSGTVHVLNLLTTGRFIIYRLNTGKFGADDAECSGKSARSSASLSPQSAAFKTMFSSRMPDSRSGLNNKNDAVSPAPYKRKCFSHRAVASQCYRHNANCGTGTEP